MTIGTGRHTVAANPQKHVITNLAVEYTNISRFPQILAAAAVRNVAAPVKSASAPTRNVDTRPTEARYLVAMTISPGVIMGPILKALVSQCLYEKGV